jgi:hypothetical protein
MEWIKCDGFVLFEWRIMLESLEGQF